MRPPRLSSGHALDSTRITQSLAPCRCLCLKLVVSKNLLRDGLFIIQKLFRTLSTHFCRSLVNGGASFLWLALAMRTGSYFSRRWALFGYCWLSETLGKPHFSDLLSQIARFLCPHAASDHEFSAHSTKLAPSISSLFRDLYPAAASAGRFLTLWSATPSRPFMPVLQHF